jgi:3-oxoacyl-[acyl-carrier-protein] synthase II
MNTTTDQYTYSCRRVVVTGLGVITPNGNSLHDFWVSVSKGQSAAAPVQKFDVKSLPVKYAAEVKNFKLKDHIDSCDNKLDTTIQYSLAAAAQAVTNAKLDLNKLDPEKIGIIEGTTISGSESVMKTQRTFLDTQNYRRLHPYNIVAGYCGEGSSTVSQQLGIKGAAITYCSGCASSNDAIGHACKLIRHDEFDIMVAGGAEEMHEMLFMGFCKLHSMSEWKGKPSYSMRPFDRERNGFLLGEGAAYLVVEELSHALARGATIYAEILGHGRTSEAYHPTSPHPEGIGYRSAITRSMRDARIALEEVDHINAHGSATKQNDPIESKATATKPLTGHLMGASGAIEAAVTIMTINEQLIPPTINLLNPDVDCDLDYVTQPRPYPVRTAMCLNAGFGGRYSCLVFRKLAETS